MVTSVSDRYIPPHGFTLVTKDYGETIIDVSIRQDVEYVTRVPNVKQDVVQYSGSPVLDVFDVESEDHLDPVAWYDEWVKPLKGE